MVIHFDEDDGEEDDVGQDDEDQGDTAPLELQDAADATVGLTGCNGADAGGVGRKTGAGGGGFLVINGFDIDVDAVDEGGELEEEGCSGECDDGCPVVSVAVVDVDVADGAEAVGYSSEDEHLSQTDGGNTPA